MSDLKMEDLIEKEEVLTPETEETIEQDPLETELEKVRAKTGRTEKEKAEFTLKKNAERVKELGGDPTSILGIERETKEEIDNEDDAPMTVGMYKKIQQQSATKTALQLASEIENETERELTKYHLENTIKSTGNPTEDLRLARSLVNAVKNTQILEEATRKVAPKTHSSASSAPLKHEDENDVVLTTQELQLMKFGGLTKEDVLKSRKSQ